MAAIVPGQGSGSTIANPSIQNTYYQFIQTTAPTQRSSGVPLVTGDRWYKPIDNGAVGTAGEWYWNGAYWLSEEIVLGHQNGGSIAYRFIANSEDVTYAFGSPSATVFINRLNIIALITGVCNGSNYWTWGGVATPYVRSASGAAINVNLANGFNTSTMTVASTPALFSFSINQSFNAPFDFRPAQWVKVGSPAELYLAISLVVHKIHP